MAKSSKNVVERLSSNINTKNNKIPYQPITQNAPKPKMQRIE